MATNQTTNYQLNQWEPTDPVLRTDFNADNAKIDAVLGDLAPKAEMLERAVVCAAYYAGRMAMLDFEKTGNRPPNRSLICENFKDASMFVSTGSAVLQNGKLVLNGTGVSTVVTGVELVPGVSGWTKAWLWLQFSGGNVVPSINGQVMTRNDTYFSTAFSGESCFEREYVWEGSPSENVQIQLSIDSGTSSSVTVYDYYLVLF